MKLNKPVTLTVNNEEVTVSDLEIMIMDDCQRKVVLARLNYSFRPLILWAKNDYDAIGDYTQSQVEQRILELLGDNPQETLQSLVAQG